MASGPARDDRVNTAIYHRHGAERNHQTNERGVFPQAYQPGGGDAEGEKSPAARAELLACHFTAPRGSHNRPQKRDSCERSSGR